jgi:hypothetical protein
MPDEGTGNLRALGLLDRTCAPWRVAGHHVSITQERYASYMYSLGPSSHDRHDPSA